MRWGRRDERQVEVRDPSVATLPSGFVTTPGRPLQPEWDAQVAYRAYVSQWLVSRAVDLLADRISSFPFRAGADPDKPGDFDKKSPLAQLLGPAPGQPSPEWTARGLWKWTIVNYLVTGRFGWQIETGTKRQVSMRPGQATVTVTDSSGIVGLWPLVTGALKPVLSGGGRSYFSGFQYTPPGEGVPVPLKRDGVVYGWNPSPGDFREPFSRLQAAALNVNIIYEIDRYSWAFMRNDARPSTMIVHGKFETPEKRDNWRRRILGNHAGADNAGTVMFTQGETDDNGKVNGSVEVLPLGASQRDSELVAIYEQQLTAVSGALGVPMSRLDASGRTFNNAGQEDINWHEDSILPLCRELADVVNRELAPRFDNGLVGWFDLSQVRALKPRLSDGVLLSQVEGDMLRDERRQFAGLGPVDQKALDAEKEHDATVAVPPMLPPPGDFVGRLPSSGTAPSIGHAKPVPGAPAGPAADNAANAKTGPIPAARPATRDDGGVPIRDERALSDADQASFDAESARIKESKKTPAAQSAHDFEAAQWTHPNGHPRCKVCGQEEPVGGECEGVEDPDAALGHSAKRHAGPDGHDHVQTGHHPAGSLGDALVKHKAAALRRYTALLGQQLATLDDKAVSSTQARAQGKRGQQLLRDGEVRADALFEPEFWTTATRSAVEPVLYAVAAAAEVALGLEPGADLEAWASARATAFAEARVAAQLDHLGREIQGHAILAPGLLAAGCEWLRGEGVSSQVIADAWDDAVRSLQPMIRREDLETLLVKFTAGEIDLETARRELETTT